MTYHIIGLGNPGEHYAATRHNVGQIILEHLREVNDFPEWCREGALNAQVSRGFMGGEEVTLVAPETFMNNSGATVKKLIDRGGMPVRCIVIHDDLDLAIGDLKVSFGRGAGGNNGIASIISSLGTKDFIRIRVGIAPKTFFGTIRRPRGGETTDFVLKKFTTGERKKIDVVATQARDVVAMILQKGYKEAMNEYNE